MNKPSTQAGPGTGGGVFAWFSGIARAKGVAAALSTFALAALAGAVALALGLTTPGRAAESFFYDLRVGALPAPPTKEPIVIVKMDDLSINEMQAASECKCLAPIDKIWLADLVATLSAKGAAVIGIDYLFDSWRTPEEYGAFVEHMRGVKTPVVAVVDPNVRPVFDYPVVPGFIYADARALVKEDYDDVVRRYDPHPPGTMPSFAAALIEAVGGVSPRGVFDLRYRAPAPGAEGENRGALAPSFPAALVASLPDQFFEGKIVMIGRVARSASADADTVPEDMHTTPMRFLAGHFDGTPGVEVHAHALAQMLEGGGVRRVDSLGVVLIVLLASLAGALIGRGTSSWWLAALSTVVGLIVVVVIAFTLYGAMGIVVPITTPLLGFALSFFLLSRLVAAQLQGERSFYSATLERYLAPQVIKRIVDGKEPVQIGAELREITVLVTDIENFSTMVAETPLDEASAIINGYFDGLMDVLWKHEAMLDKLTGDGLIALFGAPVPAKDHAQRGLACARDLDAFAQSYRVTVQQRYGRKFGRTRIGMHSGEGLVGNFGGQKRFNYTAYGQVVVIAARLEAANKEHNSRLLFSAFTHAFAGEPAGAEAVGAVTLKGVPQPVPAYTFQEFIGG